MKSQSGYELPFLFNAAQLVLIFNNEAIISGCDNEQTIKISLVQIKDIIFKVENQVELSCQVKEQGLS